MDEFPLKQVEARLRETAAEFQYPPLPDISGKVLTHLKPVPAPSRFSQPRVAWALIVLFAVVVGLLSVPPVRAQILEFIQVGIVRIFLEEPDETPALTQLPDRPTPDASLIPSLRAIAGETDLQSARERVSFPISLPGYPAELGEPDLVFLQDMNGSLVVLVWMEPTDPNEVKLSLHLIGPGSYAVNKSNPRTVEMSKVNGQTAVWAEGPYILFMKNGAMESYRLIDGHVLIWEEGELTYRLETDLPLDEAVRIAESLE